MAKLKSAIILISLLALVLPGCANVNQTPETVTGSEFMGMLGTVPYSFFEKYDVFYSNPKLSRQIHGAPDVKNMQAFEKLTDEEKKVFLNALMDTPDVLPDWYSKDGQVAELTGFSVLSADRVIMISSTPPRATWIALGDFDIRNIEDKLSGLGYMKTDYGLRSYYGIRNDFDIDMMNPLSRLVLNKMNRVAIFSNIIIISPVTEDVTAILDAIEGDTLPILSNAACQALASALGECLGAVLTTPERIIGPPEVIENAPFIFQVPADWGKLRGYEAAGLGYRADGEKRYFDITLYYRNKAAADADGKEIIKRISSYSFTLIQRSGSVPFTDYFKPGEPVVITSGTGAVLKISCEVVYQQSPAMLAPIGGSGMPVRDLLFLALEPEKYLR